MLKQFEAFSGNFPVSPAVHNGASNTKVMEKQESNLECSIALDKTSIRCMKVNELKIISGTEVNWSIII